MPAFHLSLSAFTYIVVSASVLYLAVIIATRVYGLRSFAKMSSFDFAMTVAVGSLMAAAVVSRDAMLLPGLMAVVMFYVLQGIVGKLRVHSERIQKWVDNEPLLLMDGPEVLDDNLREAGVTHDDLRAKLREANVLNYEEVRAVVLETTGNISVMHARDDSARLDRDLIKAVRR